MPTPGSPCPTTVPSPERRWRALAGWLLLALVAFGPLIDTRLHMGNVNSDLAAIESLVERGTFFINDASVDTIDKFRRGDLYFSQKSPIFHLVGAAVCAPLHAAGITLRDHPEAVLRALTLILVVLPMGVLLWAVGEHPWVRLRGRRWRLGLPLVVAFGSLMTPWAITLNHYAGAATAMMLAARRLASMREDRPSRDGAAVGFWLSVSFACDIPPAFLALGMVGVWWLLRARREPAMRRCLVWLAIGAAPLLLLYSALNRVIVGSFLPPNMHEKEMLYYEGSYWAELREAAEQGRPGYYQASYTRRLLHATVGHKGVYWMMPLLAVATVGAWRLARRRAPGWELAAGSALHLPIAIALAMVWAFDLSGGAYNIRHVVATTPPLLVVLAHPGLRWRRPMLVAAAAWGAVVATIGCINPWSSNTLSAWPPLENLARRSIASSALPDRWVGGLIDRTAIEPSVGWLDLGLDYWRVGRLNDAAAALRRAAELDPGAPLPLFHLAVALGTLNRFDESLEVSRRLVDLQPDHLGGWNNMAITALRGGRLDVAREALDASEALAPDNATMLFGRIELHRLEGRNAEAAALRDRARRLHPNDPRFQ